MPMIWNYVIMLQCSITVYTLINNSFQILFETPIIFQLFNISMNQRCVLRKGPFHPKSGTDLSTLFSDTLSTLTCPVEQTRSICSNPSSEINS